MPTDINKKYDKIALEILSKLSDNEMKAVTSYIGKKLIEQNGGSINGCYFCDKDIDANETPITVDTPVCMECQLKAANLLVAYGIDPSSMFPMVMGGRNIQPVIFEESKGENEWKI